ncbi:nucleic acid-binding, OB-fold protein [Artemisia annua]|uniref:Nucleic acid-binding, OB-fold protein n=1 Tax=Artemisia annua TaxID=35608 RepID=A0A2U1Q7F4_ARTAN|nr:nucleic acid-binding, OB-fold protein [Artemisia annua]
MRLHSNCGRELNGPVCGCEFLLVQKWYMALLIVAQTCSFYWLLHVFPFRFEHSWLLDNCSSHCVAPNDTPYFRLKSTNQNKNNHSYPNNQCAIRLSPIQQTSSFGSESGTQSDQSNTSCARRRVAKESTATKKQKTVVNGSKEYVLPLQQQQPFEQYEPAVMYKQGFHFTHDSQNHSPALPNGPAFHANKKQKGLLYANDAYNRNDTFCGPTSVLYNEGSSHTQESHRTQTPYDKWPCMPKDVLPYAKQGFFTQGGKPVCLKCQNVGPNSIFSWEGTTICMRCMNTQNPNSSNITEEGLMNNICTKSPSAYTSGTSQNRQLEWQNVGAYDEGVHDPKGKGIAYDSNINEHQRSYYSSPATTPSLNIKGSSAATTQGKRGCAQRSKKQRSNQIGGGQQLCNQQNAYCEGTLTAGNSRDTEGVSNLYIDLGDCQCPFGGIEKSNLKPEIVQSLIQILDEHNELVQVFRTARDKCEEGNVPEFKIQLYNVVASREHQLPSSETLGAIVFQPDTNSQTDFDMIIEYKDRQPKRINKLHSSYMSLQFPLLFAYGQPGYNTGLTLKGVNATKKRKKGDAIQGYTDISDKKHFSSILIPGKTYRISKFGCVPTDNWQQTLENPTSLLFSKLTKFESIPSHGRNSIELTLWDDLAQSFKKEEIDALDKPVIIAVSSCRVSRYRNNLQLESTPATYYYINPRIPELEQYRTEYRALFDINPPLHIVRHPYQNKEQEKMRNRIPLNMLLKESPQSHIGVHFTCDGVITGINTLREWYYPACKECSTKAENNGGTFDCKTHGLLDSPDYSYNFKAYITDGTETAMFTFFTPTADDFVGIKCNTLVKSLKNPNPKEIPEQLESIVGRKHIFQFHFNTTSKQKPPDFVFNQILDKSDLPKQIGDRPSASKTTENIPDAIEYELTSTTTPGLAILQTSPTHQAEHEDAGATEETNIIASPQDLISTTGTETAIATPPTPYRGMQTRSKTDDAARKTIKRPLFPEEAPDNKKKKA